MDSTTGVQAPCLTWAAAPSANASIVIDSKEAFLVMSPPRAF